MPHKVARFVVFVPKKYFIWRNSRNRFIEVVETELSSLHEGNIARYRLRPNVFANWRENWR